MIATLLLSLLLPAQAGTGALVIRSEDPVVVAVDGMLVPFAEDSLVATAVGVSGRHQVSFHNAWGRQIASHVVEVPEDFEVRCRWQRETLNCYEAVPHQASSGVGHGSRKGERPPRGTEATQTTTTTIGMGGMPTFGVVVTETTTVGTTEPTFEDLEPVAEPAVVVPDQVELIVRSTDREWADVLVDGKVVMEFRGAPEHQVTITPGLHTIEVREFMEDDDYASGRLDTGYASRVTLGITENRPITCYDHDGWYPQ